MSRVVKHSNSRQRLAKTTNKTRVIREGALLQRQKTTTFGCAFVGIELPFLGGGDSEAQRTPSSLGNMGKGTWAFRFSDLQKVELAG